MSTKATTIELNGKRYDARTGKILSTRETVTGTTKKTIKPTAKQVGVMIDGFTRRKKVVSRPKTTANTVHKKTEKSKTLMRAGVKKPTVSATKVVAKPQIQHHPKASRMDINPKRVNRAKTVQKSTLVKRFGIPQKVIKPTTANLPVQPEPIAPSLPIMSKLKSAPPKKAIQQKTFQGAINGATSHNQPRAKKITKKQLISKKLRVSTRMVNIAAVSLAGVLIVGFIAYQNVPNLSMGIATARAGISGSLPAYYPTGFGLDGPIQYQQGQITLNYSSHSDSRQFQVNQKSTEWNSDTLLENFVAADQKTYQTFQGSGKTIYIYGDNNATWVDGGVWYQIEGNSALNSDQLLRMATSM